MNGKPYLREVVLDPGDDIDYSAYPFSIPSLRHLGRLALRANATHSPILLAYPGAKNPPFR